MAATSRTLSYDAQLSTIADKIHESGAVQDAITNSNPTVAALYEGGKIKKVDVGGDQIAVNLMYQHNDTIKPYTEYEIIDVNPQDGITRMYVPWAQYGGAVSISGIQRFKNMGKEKIADLLKEKITQTTSGWSETLNAHLWDLANRQTSTHPYTRDSGKAIIPIPMWVQDATAIAGNNYDIGHIDQSAETWWKNKVKDFGASATYLILKAKMRSLYNDCSQGPNGKPDIIIADQVSYENYEAAMDPQIRYTAKEMASAGFENVSFKGAKVYWDGYVPDTNAAANGTLATGSALAGGSMYFLNTKTMTLYVGKDHDWKPRGFQTPVDQDASTSLYLAYLQLVCKDRRKNGVLYDITPTLT